MADTQLWHLLARKLSGEASLDELRELERMLEEDPELAYRVDVYIQYFEHPSKEIKRTDAKKRLSWQQCQVKLLQEFPADFEIMENDNAAAQISPEPVTRFQSPVRRYKLRLAIAACLVLAASTVFYWWGKEDAAGSKSLVVTPLWREINTPPGTRSKAILPDGTAVWLNSDSHISYNADFGKNKREIILTGEAFFDVAYNAKVPMLVKSKNVNIWVRGTAFNVKGYPESGHVETSLIRGSVELTTDADPERKILLKPSEKITIEVASESVNTHSNKPASSAKQGLYQIDKLHESVLADVIPEISWVQNKLVFDNEPFGDIIQKMEKWYNVEIHISNKKLEGRSFSGVFEKENITQALEALRLIKHFEFEVKGSSVFIR